MHLLFCAVNSSFQKTQFEISFFRIYSPPVHSRSVLLRFKVKTRFLYLLVPNAQPGISNSSCVLPAVCYGADSHGSGTSPSLAILLAMQEVEKMLLAVLCRFCFYQKTKQALSQTALSFAGASSVFRAAPRLLRCCRQWGPWTWNRLCRQQWVVP